MKRSPLKTTGPGYERAGIRRPAPAAGSHDERAAWNSAFRAFAAKHKLKVGRWGKAVNR